MKSKLTGQRLKATSSSSASLHDLDTEYLLEISSWKGKRALGRPTPVGGFFFLICEFGKLVLSGQRSHLFRVLRIMAALQR